MYMFVTPYSIQVNTGRLKKNKTKKNNKITDNAICMESCLCEEGYFSTTISASLA